MKITGYTGLYGIVAKPIKHSLSPIMHNCAFETLGMNDVYLAFEVEKDDLKQFVESAKILPIKGFNVSMPYKQEIIPYLDSLSKQASLCQAVNTVKNVDGKLIGYISDGEGFIEACKSRGWELKDKRIVVLGAGGAASAIIVALGCYGVKEINVYNRTKKEAIIKLKEQLDCPLTFHTLDEKQALRKDLIKGDILIQTTSVGMKGNEGCLLTKEDLHPTLKVADIIYEPKMTPLLKMADDMHLDYMNGEAMILYQGAVSFQYWTNQTMPIEQVKEAMRRK